MIKASAASLEEKVSGVLPKLPYLAFCLNPPDIHHTPAIVHGKILAIQKCK